MIDVTMKLDTEGVAYFEDEVATHTLPLPRFFSPPSSWPILSYGPN